VRVLVLSTDFPPHRAGGYELHCAMAVEHLRAHGHDVHVLTSAREGGAPDADPQVRRTLTRFAPEPAAAWTARDAWGAELRNAAALELALHEVRPDVVSAWRLGELSMSLVERVHRAGVPLVGMVCDPWMLDGPDRDPWSRLRGHRPAFGAAGRWLFVSDALRREVTARVDLPVTAVVHAGIRLDRLRCARAGRGRGGCCTPGACRRSRASTRRSARPRSCRGRCSTWWGRGPRPTSPSCARWRPSWAASTG
jgi:glycosyltransferase involved in cell wall biosynthesis